MGIPRVGSRFSVAPIARTIEIRQEIEWVLREVLVALTLRFVGFRVL